ncbi:peptidoglycan-associated lipoprotein Pal [Aquisalimonas sp.]|uniref:peptidoglycan-associated lipoprotein Pal n=1 Tax=unclassified Aquisalimonas TaxID=2644645 RepID=UPI0025C487BC|nr:peptidoglycan-associated lipoprotein Pal [Aquisalimonas sp.]
MMHSKRFAPWLLAAAFALVLAGCATPGEDEERVEDQDDELTEEEMAALDEEERRAAEARAARERGALEGEALEAALEDPDSPISERTVYFAFDSSDIRDDDMAILEAHGEFLSDHPNQQVTIEGHTDERGAREYNLALGERRAESVKRILVLSGASEDQLEVVSYGEENPVASGSDEEAYQQNRRAELVY